MSMNQELKKIIVARIKAVLPKGWKATFKVIDYSTLKMTVKSAPYHLSDIYGDNERGYVSLNHFHLDKIENDQLRKEVEEIVSAMLSENRIITEDADYGKVPNYYIDLSFGNYETHFVSTLKQEELKKAA